MKILMQDFFFRKSKSNIEAKVSLWSSNYDDKCYRNLIMGYNWTRKIEGKCKDNASPSSIILNC